jgi:hypothetical protein
MNNNESMFDVEKFQKEYRGYLIDRYKNGKPKLITLTYREVECYQMVVHHGGIFESPKAAWKKFRSEIRKQLKAIPLTRAELMRDLREAKKHL